MTYMPQSVRRMWIIISCLMLALSAGSLSSAIAQQAQKGEQPSQDKDDPRDICYYCENARPARAADSSPRTAKPGSKRARRYVRTTPRLPAPAQASKARQAYLTKQGYEELGITLWRYRPSKGDDEREVRIFDEDENADLTPVRINADETLSMGDRIQLSIESPRFGYLYVIDREQYTNGELSEPYLIFPNQSVAEGGNQVRAGKLIYIPSMGRRKPYFTLRELNSESKKIWGELLTVIVSPKPLPVPALRQSKTLLPDEKVKQWENRWTAPFERLDIEGGAGQTQTREEKEAAENEARIFDQDDPAPQSIYRVNVKPGNPLLINIPLRYIRSHAR